MTLIFCLLLRKCLEARDTRNLNHASETPQWVEYEALEESGHNYTDSILATHD